MWVEFYYKWAGVVNQTRPASGLLRLTAFCTPTYNWMCSAPAEVLAAFNAHKAEVAAGSMSTAGH